MTKDFKTLRENVRYFDVHFTDTGEYVRVEDDNARTAARVSVSVDENGEEDGSAGGKTLDLSGSGLG